MDKNIKSLGVFCGSRLGNQLIYREKAEQFAQTLVQHHITLVYGGAKVGLMGVIADETMRRGGQVIGVIPQSLVDIEVAHEGLTDLHIVKSMHERKALIAKLVDGFVMLPGGPGSIDEFFEIFTWAKLGLHHKPIGILNMHNYYDFLLKFIDHSISEGFLQSIYRDKIMIDESPQKLLLKLLNYQAMQHAIVLNEEIVA